MLIIIINKKYLMIYNFIQRPYVALLSCEIIVWMKIGSYRRHELLNFGIHNVRFDFGHWVSAVDLLVVWVDNVHIFCPSSARS